MPGKLELFNGIVELAKAGYKPSDGKDLLESLKTDPDLEQKGGSDLKDKTPEESKKVPRLKKLNTFFFLFSFHFFIKFPIIICKIKIFLNKKLHTKDWLSIRTL